MVWQFSPWKVWQPSKIPRGFETKHLKANVKIIGMIVNLRYIMTGKNWEPKISHCVSISSKLSRSQRNTGFWIVRWIKSKNALISDFLKVEKSWLLLIYLGIFIFEWPEYEFTKPYKNIWLMTDDYHHQIWIIHLDTVAFISNYFNYNMKKILLLIARWRETYEYRSKNSGTWITNRLVSNLVDENAAGAKLPVRADFYN